MNKIHYYSKAVENLQKKKNISEKIQNETNNYMMT